MFRSQYFLYSWYWGGSRSVFGGVILGVVKIKECVRSLAPVIDSVYFIATKKCSNSWQVSKVEKLLPYFINHFLIKFIL